jgi:hypothetical protein
MTRAGAAVLALWFLVPVSMLLLNGCYKESVKRFDGVDDVTRDPVPDPTPDAADGIDGTDIPDVDVPDEIPVQGAITFVVRNVGGETRYVHWALGEFALIWGHRTTGGAWAEIDYWPPGCMFDCAETGTGDACCIYCEAPLPRVRQILPDGEIRVTWDGRGIFEVDLDYCTCQCYWVRQPVPMAYMATVCVYSDMNCETSPCVPDENGVYDSAYPAGDEACFDAQFDIPCAQAEVVIEVE